MRVFSMQYDRNVFNKLTRRRKIFVPRFVLRFYFKFYSRLFIIVKAAGTGIGKVVN